MRDLLKAGVRRFAFAGFWPLVLLALPNCTLDRSGLCTGGCTPSHVTTGDLPHSSAIMCDIEKYQPTRRCATPDDLTNGIRLASGAEKLVTGDGNNIGLDYSLAAQAACGAGHPQAIDYYGLFPDGTFVCLNCGVIPVPHADATAVCVAKCQDLVEHDPATPPPPDVLAFCTANAHASTNFPASGCFDNACSTGGNLLDGFADPRRNPDPVVWTDLLGDTSAAGSNLSRGVTPSSGTFNAGAVSTQWIDDNGIHGNDGYVEFEATENTVSHVVGLAQVSCPFPCHDMNPDYTDINFAISLNSDGHVYLFEGGNPVLTGDGIHPAPDATGRFFTYAVGDRFRVSVTDNFNGTAAVTYSKVDPGCLAGHPCNATVFYVHVGPPAVYPLRVSASFREPNATLANVNIVRIQ